MTVEEKFRCFARMARLNEVSMNTAATMTVSLLRKLAGPRLPKTVWLDPPPKAVWMQLGVRHDAAAARLRDAGIAVVQDRCLMVEHARLLGTRAGPATRAPRLRVPVHYDFASSLCYVAHRVMQRLAPELEALGIELVWSPVDVAHRIGPIRGAGIAPAVRANAARVAAELGVDLRMPAHWIDSRPALCGALLSERAERGAGFREAAWRAVYEHGRELARPRSAGPPAR